jgi:phosphoesterase RecJ-like protein
MLLSLLKHIAQEHNELTIMVHRNADMDSVTSAFAIKHVLEDMGTRVSIVKQDKLNLPAQLFVEEYNVNIEDEGKEPVIVVDGASPEMFPKAKDKNIILIIDHHQPHTTNLTAPHTIINSEAVATAEIIATELLPHLTDEKVAEALALGIISDTARFKNATARTFNLVSQLMKKTSKDYRTLLRAAFPNPGVNEKINVLESIKNAHVMVINEKVVVIAEAPNFLESEVSGKLSEMADIVFAISYRQEEARTRVSGRVSIHTEFEMHRFLRQVAERVGGSGGGHIKAAGAFLPIPLERAKQLIVEELKKVLS